jgi:hypothetical protein
VPIFFAGTSFLPVGFVFLAISSALTFEAMSFPFTPQDAGRAGVPGLQGWALRAE